MTGPRRGLLRVALALLLASVAFGCTREYRFDGLDLSSGRRVRLCATLRAELDFSGHYRSPQLGELHLVHAGDRVRGTFHYWRAGAEVSGTLEGDVDGDLVRFDWRERHRRQDDSEVVHGRGYFLSGPPTVGTGAPRVFGRRATYNRARHPVMKGHRVRKLLPEVAFSAFKM